MIGMKIDDKNFNDAIQKLMTDLPKKTGIGGISVLDQEIGLLVKNCVKFTPPTGDAPQSESFPVKKKAGMNAIKFDILRRFKKLPKIKDKKLKKIVNKYKKDGDLYKLSTVLDRLGWKNHSVLLELNSKILDKNYRTRRGRVREGGIIYVIKQASINATIKEKSKKVGYAMSGWKAAIKKFKPKSIPAWVTALGGKGFVRVKKKGAFGWDITIGNTVNYANKNFAKRLRVIPRALKASTKNLIKKIEILVKKEAKKAGF